MKNSSKASLILGILAVIAAIWTQYSLLDGYESASAKTRAMYGLRHLSYYQYLIFGCAALLLSVASIFSKETFKVYALTLLLAIGSILLLVLPIWRSFA